MNFTRVYLMRHGEVANGGEKRYNGHIDVDITEKGVEQMHRLAGMLHGGVNRVILAEALGLNLLNLFRIDQAFGALNIIEHHPDGMTVVKLLNG